MMMRVLRRYAGVLLLVTGLHLRADEPERQPSFMLGLQEGSTVMGTFIDAAISLKTVFGDLVLPWQQVVSLRMNVDTAIVRTVSGDLIHGTPDQETVRIKAIFGEVTVPLDAVRVITASSANKPMQDACDDTGDVPPTTLMVELTDNSILRGRTTLVAVDLATPYARIQVDMQHVQSITSADEGQAVLVMRSSDRLMGEVSLPTVSLLSGCGPVSIGWEYIRKIDVIAVASPEALSAE